jgi:DtxR family transcriptional regulator, Mn-dependent transcriptional regulator
MEYTTDISLSPRKALYVKFVLEHEGEVRPSEIATSFHVDPSTVTKTINELTAMGFLLHEPYSGIRLTYKGHEYAEFLVRRHRILGLVLTHYGLSSEDACREATRFESYVPKGVIDTICRSMGHPIMGVCGKISHDPDCCLSD